MFDGRTKIWYDLSMIAPKRRIKNIGTRNSIPRSTPMQPPGVCSQDENCEGREGL